MYLRRLYGLSNISSQDLRIGLSVFIWIFYMKLDSHKVRKLAKLNFRKWRSWRIRRAQENTKITPKWDFWGFETNRINLYTFSLEHEITNDFLIFCKSASLEKICFFSYGQKMDSYKLKYLTNELKYKVEFLWMIRHH